VHFGTALVEQNDERCQTNKNRGIKSRNNNMTRIIFGTFAKISAPTKRGIFLFGIFLRSYSHYNGLDIYEQAETVSKISSFPASRNVANRVKYVQE
jgi:hypothetical protein